MKDIYWIGNTRENLADFPDEVSREMGFALYCEQIKFPHSSIKPLRGFKHAVREIKSDFKGDTYRTVYTVNLGDYLYVLHVFEKKSKRGIATPKPDMELIRMRIKEAEKHAKERK